MANRLDGVSLGLVAAGGGLVYAGIQGKSIPSLIQGFVQGKSPSAAAAAAPIAPAAAAGGFDIATNIPAGKGEYSNAAVRTLWTDNGGPADTAAFAAAVAISESSGSATVQSKNPDGGINVGLFQLDTLGVGSGYPIADLQDANLNTQVTIMATNGGVDWSDWEDSVTEAAGHTYTPGGPVP